MPIIKEQNGIFIDRYEEITASWLALIARQHIFMLGVPGVAKSMLARDMVRRIDGATIFNYLLHKTTSTSEVFGPPSLEALGRDEYRFVTKGKLPEAHIAFLDEIWKAGSGILNSLLTAVNEREFDNGGTRVSIPLQTVFSASNELPQGEELGAIYDRFLIRLLVRDLESDADFFRLLSERPNLDSPPLNTLTLAELTDIQAKVKAVDIDDVAETIVSLRQRLEAEVSLKFSSRRWLQGLSVVQAHAYINNRTTAEDTDLEVYKWILWDGTEQRQKVARIVMGTVNPLNEQLMKLMDEGVEQYEKVQNEVQAGTSDVSHIGAEANQKMRAIIGSMKDLARLGDDSFTEKVESNIRTLRGYNKWIIEHALGLDLD